MDIIRHIRNFFAHDKGHLIFDDPDVSRLCDQLKWIDSHSWDGVVLKPISARDKYIQTIMNFYAFLATGVGQPIRVLDFPAPELYA